MKRFAALVAVLSLLAVPIAAQDQTVIPLAMRWDLDAAGVANITYVNATGPHPGNGLIETSGSSTTVTAYAGNTTAFDNVVVGDAIVAAGLVRAVTARASAISITVDTALDLSAGSGLDWDYYHHQAGKTATDGVLNVSGYSKRVITWEGSVLVGDGVDDVGVIWECRPKMTGAGWTQVYPDNSAAVDTTLVYQTMYEAATGTQNANKAIAIDEVHGECRLGMFWIGADDGDDATTNRESINVTFSGYEVQN